MSTPPAAPASAPTREASVARDVPAGAPGLGDSEVEVRSAEPELEVDADGQLSAARDAPLGGQAVLEGVMMRGVHNWAVAVRKPTDEQLRDGERGRPGDRDGLRAELHEDTLAPALGEIEVSVFPLDSVMRRHRLLRLPIVRGIVALGGSLAIGFKALEVSANAQLPPEEGASGKGPAGEEEAQAEEIPKAVWIGTVVVAVAMAIVLFFLVPVGLTSLIKGQLHSSVLFWVVEGIVRTALFLGYMVLLSRIRDLRRVFEYHGAEHKTISCFEAGLALTPHNAQRFSRLHPRCGTSFLLVVMIVAIFVFAPIGLPAWYWLVITRILGVPLIAG
ncbi:MAG TPA: DUF1385 domain-containing protein, partial [Solirubrobacteraceae bacterium]|nr:DUF1385 domain-containing protein [Solirubrobacteraceae bacterium]